MKKFGYDKKNGHLFSWEFDFQYEGIVDVAPVGSIISNNRILDSMIGCAFMSGWSGIMIVIYSDGIHDEYRVFGRDAGGAFWQGQVLTQAEVKSISVNIPFCVCGEIVRQPDALAEFCKQHPTSRIYACPVINELAAFGVLAGNINRLSHRSGLVWDNTDPLDAEFMPFNPKLYGDSYGNMASIVAQGSPVVNEIMKSVGVSTFYGRDIHQFWIEGCTFIVRIMEAMKFFPETPISAKNYTATSVPVRMKTSDAFRSVTGYNEPFANVLIATDYIPGLSTFMRFYKSFSGRGVVCSTEHNTVKHGLFIPVFRSDRVYRVPNEQYEQT